MFAILSQCPCSKSTIGIWDVLILAGIVGMFLIFASKANK
jgi:hypothetical protein